MFQDLNKIENKLMFSLTNNDLTNNNVGKRMQKSDITAGNWTENLFGLKSTSKLDQPRDKNMKFFQIAPLSGKGKFLFKSLWMKRPKCYSAGFLEEVLEEV